MSSRNTLVRSLHDVGLAAWFGGTLMGAVALNSAGASVSDPQERLAVSSTGWKHWFPVQFAAMAAHGIGGVGLILGNKERLAVQGEARSNTGVKLALTLAAIGSSVYSGILGTKMAAKGNEPVEGTTEPTLGTSDELSAAQTQQRIMQWVTPAITLVLIVLAAQQGEQQRPVASSGSWVQRLIKR
jgi:hypothetical protein